MRLSGAEPKAEGPPFPEGPFTRPPRHEVCLFASLPQPSPGTLAGRDGVCEVSVRGLHAARGQRGSKASWGNSCSEHATDHRQATLDTVSDRLRSEVLKDVARPAAPNFCRMIRVLVHRAH